MKDSDTIKIVMGGYLDENNKLMTRPELDERIAKLQKKLEIAVEALELAKTCLESSASEPCRYDHHRNCQEHSWFGLNGDDCPIELWRKQLEKIQE